MGLLDNLKDKAEVLGEKAKDGFETVKDKAADGLDAAKDKATDVIGDVKDRLDGDDTPADTVAAAAGDSTDSSQDAYDEVLQAAERKAESLKTNLGPI